MVDPKRGGKPDPARNPNFETQEGALSPVAKAAMGDDPARGTTDQNPIKPETWLPKLAARTLAVFFSFDALPAREQFLVQFRDPFLLTAVPRDAHTAERTIVVPIARRAGSPSDGPAVRAVQLGRSPDADVEIPCPTVSKKHALFAAGKDGWGITDLRSTNGTRIDGKTLTPGVRMTLRTSGISISFGPDAHFFFYLPGDLYDLLAELKK